MKKDTKIKSFVAFKKGRDILRNHRIFCRSYAKKITANKVICEWFCLLNILKKNLASNSIPAFTSFPYTIYKRERPDFRVEYSDKVIHIEISKITTQRIDCLRNKTASTDDKMFEDDPSLYCDTPPQKGEHDYLIYEKKHELVGDAIYGGLPERRWAEICAQTIIKKAQKNYPVKVDYLILDDLEYHLYGSQSVQASYQLLPKVLRQAGLNDLEVFPNILANTKGVLGLIRIDYEWICNPEALPRNWMAIPLHLRIWRFLSSIIIYMIIQVKEISCLIFSSKQNMQ